MVSNGQVSSDLSAVTSAINRYETTFNELQSSWKGMSFSSAQSKVSSFVSEYSSVISNQMQQFSTALELYQEYVSRKEELRVAKNNYAQAVSYNTGNATAYNNQVNELSARVNTLKARIMECLSSISQKLEATSISSTTSSNSYVQGAVDWAIAVAADDSHGYSQSTRWGNPNYDCSSFVISAYEAAGIPVREAGAGYTGNMKDAFVSVGFQWIPGDPNVNDLQPGDILLNESHHTEMYLGDGKNIGAHSDYDGSNGDSSGKEIGITNYKSFPWQGVLRYVGVEKYNQQNV